MGIKLHNLELHKKLNEKWVKYSTVIWNAPYSLCRGEKLKREVNKSHFEFYKIVPNQPHSESNQTKSQRHESNQNRC